MVTAELMVPDDAGDFEEGVISFYRSIKDDDPSDEGRNVRLSIEEECPLLRSALEVLESFDWRQAVLSPTEHPPRRRRTDVMDLPAELRRGSTGGVGGASAKESLAEDGRNTTSDESPHRSSSSLTCNVGSALQGAVATPAEESEGSNLENESPLFDWSAELVSPPPVRARRSRRRDTSLLLLPNQPPASSNDSEPSVEGESPPEMEQSAVATNDLPTQSPEPEAVEDIQNNDEDAESESPLRDEPNRKESDEPLPTTTDDEMEVDVDDKSVSCGSDDESDASTVVHEKESLSDPLVMADGRTILTTLPEEKVDDLQAVDVTVHRRLLVENKSLRDKLNSIRSDYEERVTPFRDLFDEVRGRQS